MPEWFSIEILDGQRSALSWRDIYGDTLIYAAQAEGVRDWEWHEHRWGVLIELAFPDELAWERFRSAPSVLAALDSVPDPVSGLLVHRGRGGSSGARDPRRPRPLAGSGAAALPLPAEPPLEAHPPPVAVLVG